MPLLYGFLAMAAIVLLLHISDKRKETADDRRTKKLVERAKKNYPHNALTESLGDLHKALYNEIVLANIEDRPIERLRHDRDLLAAEVNRLWQEEIDRNKEIIEAGSSYRINRYGNLAARHVSIGSLKSSAPRTSSLAHSD